MSTSHVTDNYFKILKLEFGPLGRGDPSVISPPAGRMLHITMNWIKKSISIDIDNKSFNLANWTKFGCPVNLDILQLKTAIVINNFSPISLHTFRLLYLAIIAQQELRIVFPNSWSWVDWSIDQSPNQSILHRESMRTQVLIMAPSHRQVHSMPSN